MTPLSTEIRNTLKHRIDVADRHEILAIASAVCAQENGAAMASAHVAAAAARGGPRFVIDGDIVTDTSSGLMWTRKNVGDKALKWADAKTAAEAVRIGGHTDWRLPTIQELLALVDYSKTSPAIDPAFECGSEWYWTCTPYAGSPSGCAWFVGFNDGLSSYDDRGGEFRVRAVRAGQIVGSLG